MAIGRSKRTLELHVFGGTKGESLAVRLPDGVWGLIDCYTEDTDDPSKNLALSYLKVRNVKSLDFVCMTHPHDDHYRGLPQILDTFSVREFWQPAILDGAMLQQLIVVKSREAFRRQRRRGPKPAEDTKALEQLYRRLLAEHKKKSGISIATISIDSDIQRPGGWPQGVSVRGVGPSGKQWRRYQERLGRCFDTKDRFVGRHGDHNLCSVGIRLEWNRVALILGGDILGSGWQDAIERCQDRLKQAAVVKLAHHGSSTGRCERLWSIHASEGKPIGVVTSYNRGRSQLPEQRVLREVADCTSTLYSTHLSAPRMPLNAGSVNEVLKIVRSNASSPAPQVKTGRCSFLFDEESLIRVETDGSACEISV